MDVVYLTVYILLAILSIVTLFCNKYKWSLLGFLFFGTKGMAILPAEVDFIKASHVAFLYCILFIAKNRKYIIKQLNAGIGNKLKRLLIFFCCSIIFSIIYYRLPIVQTIIVGSRYLILSSFLFFGIMNVKDRIWLFNKVFIITFVLSVLFIIQAFTGLSILQAANEDIGLDAQGLWHGGLFPPFAGLFVFVCIFDKVFINSPMRMLGAFVFLVAIICTMFRSFMAYTFMTILVIMLFDKQTKRNIPIMIVIGLVLLLFQSQITTRASKDGKTSEDIELVLKGQFYESDYQSKDGFTMLYRFALVVERIEYLTRAPFVESIFGLGLSVDNRWAEQRYRFNYGLIDADGRVAQLRTPDIAWGNFICNYGIVGTLLFLSFYIGIINELRIRRKQSNLANVLFFSSSLAFFMSFFGADLSEPYTLLPLFFLYSIAMGKFVSKESSKSLYENNDSYCMLQC